jgi:hypothetical protein
MVLQILGVACCTGWKNLRKGTLRQERSQLKKREYSSRMEWTGGDEDLRRRRRMENAEARRMEWWTDFYTMKWLKNDNTEIQDSSDTQCGTAPPILFTGKAVNRFGSNLFSSTTATQDNHPQAAMEVDGGACGNEGQYRGGYSDN